MATHEWSWRTHTSGFEWELPSTLRSWRARERIRGPRWRHCLKRSSVPVRLVRRADQHSRVDDRSSSSSNHGPDASLSVENGELETGTGGRVELGDVGFLLGEVASESGEQANVSMLSRTRRIRRRTYGGGQTIAGPRSARILPVGTDPAAGLKMEGSRAIAHLGPTMNSAVCSNAT
jgi:hypothetical protein